MKVLVKRVVDYNVCVKADDSGVEYFGVKMSMIRSMIAVEEAVPAERKVTTEIVAVSMGVPRVRETICTVLAMAPTAESPSRPTPSCSRSR